MDIRKYGIMIAVAILTAIFIYSVADAIAPQQPDYSSCYNEPVRFAPYKEGACEQPYFDEQASQACIDEKGIYQPAGYNTSGCPTTYECSFCQKEMEEERERHNMVFFYAAVIVSIIAIIAGFLLPLGTVHEWVGLGFIIGGVIGLFMGTIQYWSDLERIARPFVIAIELAVLLFIVYKRMNTGTKKKR